VPKHLRRDRLHADGWNVSIELTSEDRSDEKKKKNTRARESAPGNKKIDTVRVYRCKKEEAPTGAWSVNEQEKIAPC